MSEVAIQASLIIAIVVSGYGIWFCLSASEWMKRDGAARRRCSDLFEAAMQAHVDAALALSVGDSARAGALIATVNETMPQYHEAMAVWERTSDGGPPVLPFVRRRTRMAAS